jgi:hypothetical protein
MPVKKLFDVGEREVFSSIYVEKMKIKDTNMFNTVGVCI